MTTETRTPFAKGGQPPARRPPCLEIATNLHDSCPHNFDSKSDILSSPSHHASLPHHTSTTDCHPSQLNEPSSHIELASDDLNEDLGWHLPPLLTLNDDGIKHRSWFSFTTQLTCEQGTYPYSLDLLALAKAATTQASNISTKHHLVAINSPLISTEWERALEQHPDSNLKSYLLAGLRNGFRIGFSPSQQLQSASENMRSALINPEPVQKYLQTEVEAGRVLGPLDESLRSHIHISRFGVIPKKHQPGKWRLILDLSFPSGKSVNDGIPRDLASLQYVSVDDAARIIMSMGRNTELAKVDIAHAFRNVPIHPQDRHLLGMQWEGRVYIDTCLPFGFAPRQRFSRRSLTHLSGY